MIHWNVHVKYESELQSATYSADCSADCRSDMFIPVYQTNGRSINNTIGVVMNLLVGMGLNPFNPIRPYMASIQPMPNMILIFQETFDNYITNI